MTAGDSNTPSPVRARGADSGMSQVCSTQLLPHAACCRVEIVGDGQLNPLRRQAAERRLYWLVGHSERLLKKGLRQVIDAGADVDQFTRSLARIGIDRINDDEIETQLSFLIGMFEGPRGRPTRTPTLEGW